MKGTDSLLVKLGIFCLTIKNTNSYGDWKSYGLGTGWSLNEKLVQVQLLIVPVL